MRGTSSLRIAALAACLVCFPSLARADTWYYQTQASDHAGASNILWSTTPSPGHPWGGIELVGPSYGAAHGSREIVLTNLRAFSCAPSDQPEVFKDVGYRLQLSILDTASNQSGTVTFTGLLNGLLSQETAKIDNTFTGNMVHTLSLGGTLYTITIGNFVPPGPPSSGLLGAITAHVSLSTVTDTPEPSTLLLGGIGCAFLGWARWRKRPGTHK